MPTMPATTPSVCSAGGSLACAFTHAGITPLDVTQVTCRCVLVSRLSSPISCMSLVCKPRVDCDPLLRLSLACELGRQALSSRSVIGARSLAAAPQRRTSVFLDHRAGGSCRLCMSGYDRTALLVLFVCCCWGTVVCLCVGSVRTSVPCLLQFFAAHAVRCEYSNKG